MVKKIFHYSLGIVIAWSVQFLLLFEIMYVEIMRTDFFLRLYEKSGYSISELLGISNENLRSILDYMFSCVKTGTSDTNLLLEMKGETTEFFNERELEHLEDVFCIISDIRVAVIVMLIIGIILIVYLIYKKDILVLFKAFLWSELGTLAVGGLVGFIASQNMLLFVNGFHRLFFDNNAWILNPVTDYLIYFFPTQLFGQILAYLGMRTTVEWMALSILCVVVIRRNSHVNNKKKLMSTS